MIGVITRTDLLNILVSEPARIPEFTVDGKGWKANVRERRVAKFLRERLPEEIIELLMAVGRVADLLWVQCLRSGWFCQGCLSVPGES